LIFRAESSKLVVIIDKFLQLHTVYLLLGANLGDRRKNLLLAQYYIRQFCGNIAGTSCIYVTEPWGNHNQPDYYNQSLLLHTGKSPFQLLNALRRIEKKLGRRTKNQNSARTLDIDILFYDDIIFQTSKLSIPHPRLHLRNFTLKPLAELNKDLLHPVFNKTIAGLQKDCADTGKVSILAG
jgi:2-amino-4-hydroxy-6-hydroxymethyldihydropteridine diphosphokinase